VSYTREDTVTATATTPDVLQVKLTDEWAKNAMARAVPGSYWDPEARAHMVIDPSPRAAAVILRLFPELGVKHPELAELRDSLLGDIRPFDNATPAGLYLSAPTVEAELAKEGHRFYEFQSLDGGYISAVLERHGGAYIGHERGLGKTLSTCGVIDHLGLDSVLIVAPNTAKEPVWGAELARFLPTHEVVVMRNTKTQRERDLRYAKALRKQGQRLVLVVHYEALDILHDAKRSDVTWTQLGEWDLVAADEAHRLSNTKAKMTKAIKKIPTKRKLALSGSIIQNHAEELFSVLQWLYPERYRSKWRDWNDRYLDYVENGYARICVGVKPERIDEMRQELGVGMVYRRKEDELDLPAKTEQTLLVPLSPQQRKHYDQLLEECMTQLDDQTVVKAAEGLVMLTRLRQIATGLDLLGHEVSDSSKCDLAIEMIEDTPDEATVVFTWFKANARSMHERLEAKGIPSFLVTGDVSQKNRNDYIKRFQAGEGRVFIGTLSTLGESVNLQRASHAIFLDRSFNPGVNTQAQDRIYRIGQRRPVTVTHVIAKSTVDEYRVLPVIETKAALRRLILGGL
jgi:SNF2 family DNA or RNA helicase